jgi:hypothetical protein
MEWDQIGGTPEAVTEEIGDSDWERRRRVGRAMAAGAAIAEQRHRWGRGEVRAASRHFSQTLNRSSLFSKNNRRRLRKERDWIGELMTTRHEEYISYSACLVPSRKRMARRNYHKRSSMITNGRYGSVL